MNNIDYSSYKVDISKYYDGFIDPRGRYYRVKEKGSSDELHNLWAKNFIKNYSAVLNVDININYNTINCIKNINNFEDILINIFGFISYKHDSIYLKPIIKLPNPKIAEVRVSKEQIEALYNIMSINQENPINKEFIIDANQFYYNVLEDETERKIR